MLLTGMLSLCLAVLPPSSAIEALKAGNVRFEKKESLILPARKNLAESQAPFAIVITCSDSRVPPEMIFDQDLGKLFVVRVAGNVIGPLEMESIEYAAKYLKSSCIVVMGHQNCGAVDAVIKGQTADIRYIAQIINKSMLRAEKEKPKDLLKKTIEFNALEMADFISYSPLIAPLLAEKKLTLHAAYYDLITGHVTFLENK
jgi:carbonic anhydrase